MVIAREKILPDEYYDEGDGGVLYDTPIVYSNPTWRQRKMIEFLKTISRGVMLVTGQPRSGKDLFGVTVAYLNKLFFGRRVLLDFKPCRLFGEYEPFDPRMMMNEVNKMAKLAGVNHDNGDEPFDLSREQVIMSAAKEWVDSKDVQVLFQGAVVYLSELKRYCYNRHPHNPINKLIGAICTQWGHLDMLVIGTHIQAHEIDQYTFKYYTKHWAKCTWSLTRPDTTEVTISRGVFLTEGGMFDLVAKPIKIYVNGAEPRDYLDGKGLYELYNSKNFVNLKPVVRKEL